MGPSCRSAASRIRSSSRARVVQSSSRLRVPARAATSPARPCSRARTSPNSTIDPTAVTSPSVCRPRSSCTTWTAGASSDAAARNPSRQRVRRASRRGAGSARVRMVGCRATAPQHAYQAIQPVSIGLPV
jgi:hypothetical protein